MNNKLMSYENTLKELKRLENYQRLYKSNRKKCSNVKEHSFVQIDLNVRKKRINELLTIIHLHKESRRLWNEKNYWKLKYLGVPCE